MYSTAQVVSPGLANDHPRELLCSLVNAYGLVLVHHGEGAPEDLYRAAVEAVPALRDSHHVARGFMEAEEEWDIRWTALDSGKGAGLVIMFGGGSDTLRFITEVVDPLNALPHTTTDMLSRGEGSGKAVELVNLAHVVPVWEFPSLSHLGSPGTFPTMPGSLRRAARGWEEISADLYQRSVVTPMSDSYPCGLALYNGIPRLQTVLLTEARPDHVMALDPVTELGPYSLELWDDLDTPLLMLTRTVPAGISTQDLNEAAQQLCIDVYRGLHQLGVVS